MARPGKRSRVDMRVESAKRGTKRTLVQSGGMEKAQYRKRSKVDSKVDTVHRAKRVRLETDVRRSKRIRVQRECEYSRRKFQYTQDSTTGTVADDSIITKYGWKTIEADGRCLFRSVAHAWCLRRGMGAPNATAERELADDLRSRVADELIRRREIVCMFMDEDEDFDQYVMNMRNVDNWGGERELAMLCHVIRLPIYVYKRTAEQATGSPLRLYSTYGDLEYHGRAIEVLHCMEHYEVLDIVEST